MRADGEEEAVGRVGVGHKLHPGELNRLRPLVMDAALTRPKELTAIGWSRNFMKPINATISAGSVLPTLNPEWFSGVPLVAHCGFSSRSFGKFSLVTAISTLKASPAKIRSDLF